MSTSAGTYVPTEQDIIAAILNTKPLDLIPEGREEEGVKETVLDTMLEQDPVALAYARLSGTPIRTANKVVYEPPQPWYDRYYGRFAKSVIYRFYSSCVTMLISYALTGKGKLSVALGVLDFCVKIFTYWIFEMAWWKIVKQSPKLKKVFNT